jgi:hypothetical protein
MELPPVEPSGCLQAYVVAVIEDIGRIYQPADREWLLGMASFGKRRRDVLQ